MIIDARLYSFYFAPTLLEIAEFIDYTAEVSYKLLKLIFVPVFVAEVAMFVFAAVVEHLYISFENLFNILYFWLLLSYLIKCEYIYGIHHH